MNNLLLSFQICFLIIVLIYAIKIKQLSTTPNMPYNIGIATLVLMATWRISKLLNYISVETATVIIVFITFLWICFFINIHTLLKHKNG